MLLREDYMSLKRELKGEQLEKFNRVWDALCKIEDELYFMISEKDRILKAVEENRKRSLDLVPDDGNPAGEHLRGMIDSFHFMFMDMVKG